MTKLLFATHNRHKLEEVRMMLPEGFTVFSLEEAGFRSEVPENEDTIEGNALAKAKFISAKLENSCFADDSGLEVYALDGAPGVISARYAGNQRSDIDNRTLLLKKMKGKKDRGARFRTVIALIIDDKEVLFEGIVEGTISESEKGETGFGYDPIFIPEGHTKTFAQMSAEQKNSISHRRKAIDKMVQWLSENF